MVLVLGLRRGVRKRKNVVAELEWVVRLRLFPTSKRFDSGPS